MKAAFDKFDITPATQVYMAGYARKNKSTGILDPIEINTLALEIDGLPLIISIFDSIIIEENFVNCIKHEIMKKLNIPAENVIIGCIHTHSAPAFFKLAFEDTIVEHELTEKTKENIIESIIRAYNKLEEATVKFEKTIVEGLYGNRNIKDGYADKSINVLNFYNQHNSLIGSFVNISVHPTILNGNNLLLSADLVGFLRKKLQEDLKAPVLISNGTCGDVSTRFYRTMSGLEELEYTSSSIAQQIKNKVVSKALNLGKPKITTVSMTSVFDAAKDDFNNSELEKLYNKIGTAQEPECSYLKFMASRLEKKRELSPYELHLTSTIFKTDELMIITLPGDVNSYFAKLIKESFPDREVIIIGYSNAYVSYMVEAESYGKYFETFNTRLSRNVSDTFINNVIDTAKAL